MNTSGKQILYIFLDTNQRILRLICRQSGLQKEDIINICSIIISDEFNSMINDHLNIEDYQIWRLIPNLLSCWMKGIIKSKSPSSTTKSVERRRIAIAHSLISAARPRSFVSQILLAISTNVNAKLESRSLSFADNYRELLRLHDGLMPKQNERLELIGDLHQFVFHNADINVHTLRGLDTWHVMGGIAISTPASNEPQEPLISRCTQIHSPNQLGQISHIQIQKYSKLPGTCLKNGLLCHILPYHQY